MLNLEEEHEIVALLYCGTSQSATAVYTGHTQDAVRRVKSEGEKWAQFYPRTKLKPSELSRLFQAMAEVNDQEDVELLWPTPRVSQKAFRRLTQNMTGNDQTREMLKNLREETLMFETLHASEDWWEELRQRISEVSPAIGELVDARAKQDPGC